MAGCAPERCVQVLSSLFSCCLRSPLVLLYVCPRHVVSPSFILLVCSFRFPSLTLLSSAVLLTRSFFCCHAVYAAFRSRGWGCGRPQQQRFSPTKLLGVYAGIVSFYVCTYIYIYYIIYIKCVWHAAYICAIFVINSNSIHLAQLTLSRQRPWNQQVFPQSEKGLRSCLASKPTFDPTCTKRIEKDGYVMLFSCLLFLASHCFSGFSCCSVRASLFLASHCFSAFPAFCACVAFPCFSAFPAFCACVAFPCFALLLLFWLFLLFCAGIRIKKEQDQQQTIRSLQKK